MQMQVGLETPGIRGSHWIKVLRQFSDSSANHALPSRAHNEYPTHLMLNRNRAVSIFFLFVKHPFFSNSFAERNIESVPFSVNAELNRGE